MISADDYKVTSLVTAAFTPDRSAFNSSKALAALLGKFADRYNGEVQALPLPSDAPDELPRLILQSRPGDWQLTASPFRLNSSWKAVAPQQLIFGDIVMGCAAPIETYIEAASAKVGRLALIIRRRLVINDAAQILIDKFCNKETQNLFEHSGNFEIHNRKTYKLPKTEWTVNSWVRCKSIMTLPESESGISIEQDMNTLSEDIETQVFSVEDTRRFFMLALEDAITTFERYFPK